MTNDSTSKPYLSRLAFNFSSTREDNSLKCEEICKIEIPFSSIALAKTSLTAINSIPLILRLTLSMLNSFIVPTTLTTNFLLSLTLIPV